MRISVKATHQCFIVLADFVMQVFGIQMLVSFESGPKGISASAGIGSLHVCTDFWWDISARLAHARIKHTLEGKRRCFGDGRKRCMDHKPMESLTRLTRMGLQYRRKG